MDEQFTPLFESFKQELMDIYTTNSDALLCIPGAWQGEASIAYLNTLRAQGEDILALIQRVEYLQEKINVFVNSLSNTDMSI